MKKFKRFCVIVLAITFILCTALTSAVYAAPTAVNTVQDGVSVKAGDEFSFYVDLTSPYTLKEISAVVLYDTQALDLLTYDPSVAMSYINTNYEPPMESTQNGNGIEFSVFIYEINETTIGVKADTDNNGTYETEIKTESENPLLGDVNLDKKLNIKDATAIQKHLATVITLDSKALSVADFNEDGKLNIKDVTSIQKRLAGIV